MKTLTSGTLSAAALGLILSCGGGGGYGGGSSSYTPPPPPPPAGTINVGNASGYGGTSNIFNPATLTVKAGDTVTWNWESAGHTVDSGTACTPDAAGPDHYTSGGTQAAGFTMTHTFATAGTYHYYCGTHCAVGMTGTIIVNP